MLKDEMLMIYVDLYHGTFKLANQIVQFKENIFHTHLLGGEQVNRPIKISFYVSL